MYCKIGVKSYKTAMNMGVCMEVGGGGDIDHFQHHTNETIRDDIYRFQQQTYDTIWVF